MDLIRAFRSLPSDTVLLLVGEGCLRKEIIQLPRHHPNLRGRIHLAGPVPHDRMPDYYRRMDVCVLPSRTETGWVESFGRVLIESMACGTPVIGSDSGAIPSTIGEAGLVYREGDYHALASRLLDLLVQPRLAEKLRDRGLNRCRVFSWSRIAKDHWRLYREVMP